MKILYFILLIAAALFYPLYRDDLSFYTLAALCIMPLLLWGELFYSRLRTKISFSGQRICAEKNKAAQVEMSVRNRGIFPLPNTRIVLKVRFAAGGEEQVTGYSVPVPGRKKETVCFKIRSEHCGMAVVTVESVRIYDVLRMFSMKIPVAQRAEVCFVPPEKQITERNDEDKRQIEAAEELFEETRHRPLRKGEESTEVTGYREYRSGDKISRINYKLSSRFDKDIVRETASAELNKFAVMPDFAGCIAPDGKMNLSDSDRILLHAMITAYDMMTEGIDVYLYLSGMPDDETVSETVLSETVLSETGCLYRCTDISCITEYAQAAVRLLSPENAWGIPESTDRLPFGFGGIAVTLAEKDIPDGFRQIIIDSQ